MRFAAIYDQLRRQGPVKPKTGEPPLLQMAVLTRTYRRVLRQPSIAGLLIPPLALVGRLRGYRARFPEIED
jgi:hypothetical protein